ncbi:unnamed protein product [Lampetra planeri]
MPNDDDGGGGGGADDEADEKNLGGSGISGACRRPSTPRAPTVSPNGLTLAHCATDSFTATASETDGAGEPTPLRLVTMAAVQHGKHEEVLPVVPSQPKGDRERDCAP